MRWKKGDWCYFEMELNIIKEVKGNKVQEVSDTVCKHFGNLTDLCFPLTEKIKRWSDDCFYYYNEVYHEIDTQYCPRYYDDFCNVWKVGCEAIMKKKDIMSNRKDLIMLYKNWIRGGY